nr:MAG TPA: hypothetical protein [Caudoviricetes sp.]
MRVAAKRTCRVPRDESGTIGPMRGVARALTFVAALRR